METVRHSMLATSLPTWSAGGYPSVSLNIILIHLVILLVLGLLL